MKNALFANFQQSTFPQRSVQPVEKVALATGGRSDAVGPFDLPAGSVVPGGFAYSVRRPAATMGDDAAPSKTIVRVVLPDDGVPELVVPAGEGLPQADGYEVPRYKVSRLNLT